MVFVPPLPFEQARQVVLDTIAARRSRRAVERISVAESSGRVLAVDVVGRVLRAVGRDLSPAARYDYEWASVLLAPAGLAPGLVALMAIEAAIDTAPVSPCLAAWLKLSLTPGLTSAHLRRLLAAFGDPERVLAAGRRALAQHVTDAIAVAIQQGAALMHWPPQENGSRTLQTPSSRWLIATIQRVCCRSPTRRRCST